MNVFWSMIGLITGFRYNLNRLFGDDSLFIIASATMVLVTLF